MPTDGPLFWGYFHDILGYLRPRYVDGEGHWCLLPHKIVAETILEQPKY